MNGFALKLIESVLDEWSSLPVGVHLSVVKLAPDGSQVARYPGVVVQPLDEDNWTVLHATWTHRTIELDGLAFRAGDHLLEWFSPTQPINAFAILTDQGHFKGWYANVTKPARLDLSEDPAVLTWHDLFVDLVGLPDKTFSIRDDDELEASGLRHSNPASHECILRARSEMIRRFESELPPFADIPKLKQILARLEPSASAP